MQLLAAEASNLFSNAQRTGQPVRQITPNHLASTEDSFSKTSRSSAMEPQFGKSSFKDNVHAAREGTTLLRQAGQVGARNTHVIFGGLSRWLDGGSFSSGARSGADRAERAFQDSHRRWNNAGSNTYTPPTRRVVAVEHYRNGRYSHTTHEYR